MKKAMALVLAIGLFCLHGWGKERISLNLNVTSNFSLDDRYTDIYGVFHLGADLTCAWNFFNHFTLWTGIGVIPAFSTIPDLDDSTTSFQIFGQLGLGYNFKLFEGIYINLHSGAALVLIWEKTMGTSASKTAWGFEGGLDVQIPIKKRLFLSFFSDFIFSRTKYNQNEMRPGGLRLGIGIGKRF